MSATSPLRVRAAAVGLSAMALMTVAAVTAPSGQAAAPAGGRPAAMRRRCHHPEVRTELRRPAELTSAGGARQQDAGRLPQPSSGLGRNHAKGRDECASAKGWLPAGTYTVGARQTRYNGNLIKGYAIPLSNKTCKNGRTTRTELFIHSEMTRTGGQGSTESRLGRRGRLQVRGLHQARPGGHQEALPQPRPGRGAQASRRRLTAGRGGVILVVGACVRPGAPPAPKMGHRTDPYPVSAPAPRTEAYAVAAAGPGDPWRGTMIVSMVSMPEGTVTNPHVSEAREHLTASRFLLVDVELPEEQPPDEQPVAHLLGLETEDVAWLGREGESARAEFLGDSAAFVVPAVEADRITHVHAFVTERYLITVHR